MRRTITACFLTFASAFGAYPAMAVAASARPQLPLVLAPAPPSATGALDATWSSASRASVDWDFSHARPASDATDVYVTADASYLYVAFDAKQRDPIVATQGTNNVGEGSDDEVFVYLWPSGSNGFLYSFSANPRGTRYQSSTENTAYAPEWLARGKIGPNGYVVTMRIPLKSIRGDGRGTWLAQFVRRKFTAQETDEWSHDGAQTSVNLAPYAGALTGMSSVAKSARVKPRVAVYGLADAAAALLGGPTSRAGADLSIPITQTASVLATIHPDYSNVEVDQQTIAPTAFQRTFTEVRPFFTQTANFLDAVSCLACPGISAPGISELYTPSIPTPRRGYAVEGVQDKFRFAAFDAVGDGRVDTSADVTFRTSDQQLRISFDRTTADVSATPDSVSVHDIVSTVSVNYDDLRHFFGYVEYGHELGSLVSANSQRYDTGFLYYTKDNQVGISFRKLGASYRPYDGYIQLSDIAGYGGFAGHTFNFTENSKLANVSINASIDKYAGSRDGTNLYDFDTNLSLAARNKFSLALNTATQYARLPGDILRPYTQSGGGIYYTQGTTTESTFGQYVGHYADGYLSTTQRHAGFRFARKTTINLQSDETDWHGQSGIRAVQWLERASVTYVVGRDASIVVGARKIVGAPPPIGALPQPVVGTNVSVAFTKRRKNDELYFVYGDSSAFQTRPAVTLKFIHYFGAEKGT